MTDAAQEGTQAVQPSCQPERVLLVPRAILGQTHDYFVPYWRARVETACFWFGVDGETRQVVTTLAIPRLRQSWGHYQVVSDSLRWLAADMRAQGLLNLVQVHTHPLARVDHSPYDDENAYSTREGALSLVWPHYGATLHHDIADVGVHERRCGRWVRLRDEEVRRRVRVVDSVADSRWTIVPDETDDEH